MAIDAFVWFVFMNPIVFLAKSHSMGHTLLGEVLIPEGPCLSFLRINVWSLGRPLYLFLIPVLTNDLGDGCKKVEGKW